MPDLLLELFSEEIPARMQRRAAEDLRKLVTDALVARGLVYEGAKAFATPRRLALHVAGLPVQGQAQREEKKGPRIDAPDAAIQGFLKSAGLTSVDQATIESDPKKGQFYVAITQKPGQMTVAALAEIIPDVIRNFPWPKSMRWGAASASPSSLRWVRPLQSILCTFGAETEEPEVVAFEVGGITSSNITYGHRFMAPGAIKVRRFEDYVASLEKAKVVLDADRRKDIIANEARTLAFAQGLELVEDEGLLEEVAGLVEWPVVLMGAFEERFLDVPAEAVRATIRANQKCFVLRQSSLLPLREKVDAQRPDEGAGQQSNKAPHPSASPPPSPSRGEGALSNRFILVSNLIASDGGAAIIAGNERVVRARLSDAAYFWETDRKPLPDYADKASKPLDQRLEKLKALNIVFHAKLGTQGERVARIAALARELAPVVGADPDLAERAARLCKADLVTEMVGEFPELQGLMGRKYAELQGEHPSVCAAIEDHYKPQGPTDRVPTDPVAVTVALADKLDTLVGFWAIDEKLTGSKDPYALRRAALGVIRLVIENGVRLGLLQLFETASMRIQSTLYYRESVVRGVVGGVSAEQALKNLEGAKLAELPDAGRSFFELRNDLLTFFHERLKVSLREQGARHDLVDAVLGAGATSSVMLVLGLDPRIVPSTHALPFEQGASAFQNSDAAPKDVGGRDKPDHDAGNSKSPSPTLLHKGGEGAKGVESTANDDLLLIVLRVEALTAFLSTEDGTNLLAGYKRAANILKAEEKKDGEGAFEAAADLGVLPEPEDKALGASLAVAENEAASAVGREDYAAAMRAMAALRAPVDAFFEKVMVNAPEAPLRMNRLRLLAQLRRVTLTVADFGKIAG